MRFRPCIDIHNGKVKQIVGSSLKDEGGEAANNFVSDKNADSYARLYKERGLRGGHVIILNPRGSEHYEADLRQAQLALSEYEGGLQIGGGITDENAVDFLNMGASHVIVTSYVFRGGEIDFARLKKADGSHRQRAAGARPLVQKAGRRVLYRHRPLAEIHRHGAFRANARPAFAKLCRISDTRGGR